MSISRAELEDAARRAFGGLGLESDPEHSWKLVVDMGWLAMGVPERLGGLGLGAEAAAVIHAELGRALIPGPVIGQMLALRALCAAEAFSGQDQLLAAALDGQVFAFALEDKADGGVVVDADHARWLIVADADGVYLIAMDAPGVAIRPRPAWDRSRRLFDVTVQPETPRRTLLSGAAAQALIGVLRVERHLALAADSLGGAAAILERTVAYLGTRRQFGRPLAMFQALKHRVADLAARIAAADALLRRLSQGEAPDAVDAGALKAHAAQLYADVSEEAIQLHGGIGLTMEHDCHRYLKRALLTLSLGGTVDALEEDAGRRVLEQAG